MLNHIIDKNKDFAESKYSKALEQNKKLINKIKGIYLNKCVAALNPFYVRWVNFAFNINSSAPKEIYTMFRELLSKKTPALYDNKFIKAISFLLSFIISPIVLAILIPLTIVAIPVAPLLINKNRVDKLLKQFYTKYGRQIYLNNGNKDNLPDLLCGLAVKDEMVDYKNSLKFYKNLPNKIQNPNNKKPNFVLFTQNIGHVFDNKSQDFITSFTSELNFNNFVQKSSVVEQIENNTKYRSNTNNFHFMKIGNAKSKQLEGVIELSTNYLKEYFNKIGENVDYICENEESCNILYDNTNSTLIICINKTYLKIKSDKRDNLLEFIKTKLKYEDQTDCVSYYHSDDYKEHKGKNNAKENFTTEVKTTTSSPLKDNSVRQENKNIISDNDNSKPTEQNLKENSPMLNTSNKSVSNDDSCNSNDSSSIIKLEELELSGFKIDEGSRIEHESIDRSKNQSRRNSEEIIALNLSATSSNLL